MQQERIKQIADAAQVYGWEVNAHDGDIMLFNRNNSHAATVKLGKGSKYRVEDSHGNKLLTGNNAPAVGVTKVLEQYFYANKNK